MEQTIALLKRTKLGLLYNLMLDIEQRHNEHPAEKFVVKFWSRERAASFKKRIPEYEINHVAILKGMRRLKELNVFEYYREFGEPSSDKKSDFEIALNIQKFHVCFDLIRNKRTGKSRTKKQGHSSENLDGILFEVRHLPSGEIMLNNFLLSRPDFDGENYRVFEYVFKNPGKRISLSTIKEKVPDAGKDLPRMVDNWGFKGDVRKAFFQVSKIAIKFCNPIRSSDLSALNIAHLRFPTK